MNQLAGGHKSKRPILADENTPSIAVKPEEPQYRPNTHSVDPGIETSAKIPVLADSMIPERRQSKESPLNSVEHEKQTQENSGALVRPPERQSARVAAGVRRPQRYQSFHTSLHKALKEFGKDACKAKIANKITDEENNPIIYIPEGEIRRKRPGYIVSCSWTS